MMNENISSQCEKIVHVLADAMSYPLRNEKVRNDGRNVEQPRRQDENQEELPREILRRQQDEGDVDAEEYYRNSSRRSHRRHRRVRDERGQNQDSFGSLKLRVPQFQGKNDPNAYLEWEKKIEMVFDCQFYLEANKVKVVWLLILVTMLCVGGIN
ncbi:hypothetical protein V5N11_033115 [Cardamine amara subsp. amara]|uniref:Uncharacterized protein n=1 Tax=Cardamine amara subsp. amara TaxID=228776 RepID=A0ABD1AR66_CARAN